jgi:hypothetical protein
MLFGEHISMRIAVAAIVALLCAGSTARADWQYTKWGMTESQLSAVTKGSVIRTVPPHQTGGNTLDVKADVVMTSGVNLGSMYYTVHYYFRSDRLAMVALTPKTEQEGVETGRLLETKYGPPEREQRMGKNEGWPGCIIRRRWRSEKDGNLITFLDRCGTQSEVRYEPLNVNTGL